MQRYRTIGDLPATLPVFPLAGVLLLPRTLLPLNIFEPRYLSMIDDCLRGDRLVGIIQPVGDGGRTGSPEGRVKLRAVGCAGRLRSWQEADDGRMAIVLSGIARFRPVEELAPEKPYRAFRVDWSGFAHDLAPGHGAAEADRGRLLEVLKRYLRARGLEADWSRLDALETEALINTLAMVSPFGAEERQALIEAITPAERARHLVALAEMELAAGQAGGGERLQ